MKTRRQTRLGFSAAGFSLLELVLVIILLSIAAAVAAPFIGNGFKAYFTGRDLVETDWQARVALERITRELRTARAPADLIISPANELTFIDIDGNSIRYCMGTVNACPGASGELTRNAQALATGISGLSFSYLTKAAVTTATASQVFYVIVDFTATQGLSSRAYQATVSPRNFP